MMASANDDYNLPEGSRRVLTECFKKYDKSGDGVIEISELPRALAFAGIFATEQGYKELAYLLDSSRDGKLQISELVDSWKVLAEHSMNGEELLTAFKKIDRNGDGYIQIPELKFILMKTGDKMSLQEAEACIRTLMKYDTHQDGKFTYAEFVRMYTESMYPFKKPENVDKKDITQDFETVKVEEEKAVEKESSNESEQKSSEQVS